MQDSAFASRIPVILLMVGLFWVPALGADPPIVVEKVEVKGLWHHGAHNAFTDLIRWRDRFYCTFREGYQHVSYDGKIRVLVSEDGETQNWRLPPTTDSCSWDSSDWSTTHRTPPAVLFPSLKMDGTGPIPRGEPLEAYLEKLRTIRRWMDRYPEIKVVLTHGFAWRSFMHSDGISLPDEVFAAAPSDHPNFYVQLLFAIFFGGVWDYPMPQIRTTLEQVAENIGVDRLIWGTDIPMVMRFVTYRQSLESLRVNLDFLTEDEIGRIVGGNMGRLMGVD